MAGQPEGRGSHRYPAADVQREQVLHVLPVPACRGLAGRGQAGEDGLGPLDRQDAAAPRGSVRPSPFAVLEDAVGADRLRRLRTAVRLGPPEPASGAVASRYWRRASLTTVAAGTPRANAAHASCSFRGASSQRVSRARPLAEAWRERVLAIRRASPCGRRLRGHFLASTARPAMRAGQTPGLGAGRPRRPGGRMRGRCQTGVYTLGPAQAEFRGGDGLYH